MRDADPRQRHRPRGRTRARRTRIVAAGGCRTAKVKVAEPGQTLADDQARLEAVRDALGPRRRRSGSTPTALWYVDDAVAAIAVLDRAAGGLEYVEQPCASVEDLAVVRRRVDVPIAADESIRRAADPYRVRDLEAADVAVLKVQPLGGVRACLRIAEDIGLPVVVSSALETSRRHRRRGSPWPRRCPSCRTPAASPPCSCSTADVVADPLLPVDGYAAGAARRSSTTLPWTWSLATDDRVGALGGAARRGASGAAGSLRSVTSHRPRPRGRHRLIEAGVTEIVVAPGSRNAPLSFAVYDAAEAGLVRLHTRIDERSAGFLALGPARKSAPGRRSICTSGTARRQPAPRDARGRARRRRRWSRSPPTGPTRLRGTSANQTTDQVGIFGRLVPVLDVVDGGLPDRSWATAPCTSTCSSTSRWCPRTGGARRRVPATDRARVRPAMP